MELPKKKARIVRQAVEGLLAEKVIDEDTAARIRANITPLAFDWRRLARYSFIAALACIVIAVGTIFFDDAIVRLIERLAPVVERLFNAPPVVRGAYLGVLSALLVWLGLKQRARAAERIYSNETIFFAAAAGVGGVAYNLGLVLHWAGPAFAFTLAGFAYLALGAAVRSKVVWTVGLLALAAALGAGVDYEWGGYCLWFEHPLRSLAYGALLFIGAEALPVAERFASAEAHRWAERLALFRGVTRVVGLLHVFIALWILSIWGRGGWRIDESFRIEIGLWAVLFALTSVAAVARALQKDDAVLRGFGLTFFFIELYTKFFEYFWSGLDKAVFFAILGASFWLLGRKAETLWRLKLRGKSGE